MKKNSLLEDQQQTKMVWVMIFFIGFLMVFNIKNINAIDWDNVKSYNSNNQEETIKNLFGLGNEIATIQLLTPHENFVMPGKDRLVAELYFDVNQNSMNYNNIFKLMEFYNKRSNSKIDKPLTYKYKSKTGTINIPVYKKICGATSNGTQCELKLIGYKTEDTYSWIEITNNDFKNLPSNQLIIGIFSDVGEKDYVEWIPTFFGVRINEWAIWTSSLNNGLALYYDGNSTIDLVYGIYNLTNREGSPTYGSTTGCLLGQCIALTTNNNFKVKESLVTNWGAGNVTVNFWTNMTNGDITLVMTVARATPGAETTNNGFIAVGDNSVQNWYEGSALTGTTTATQGQTDGTYYMHTWTRNDSGWGKWYINGTLIVQGQSSMTNGQSNVSFGSSFGGGEDMIGSFDEISFWNRTLLQTEIIDLYNNKEGLTYDKSPGGIGISLISPTSNSNLFTRTIDFLVNVSDPNEVGVKNVTLLINNVINETNISGLTGVYNFSIPLAYANYNWSANAYSVIEVSATSEIRAFESNSLFVINETYDSQITEGLSSIFLISVATNGSDISIATLKYNSTDYSGTINDHGNNNFTISRSIASPFITANTNISFYWTIVQKGGNSINRSEANQTIINIEADDCTSFTNRLYNFSLEDEKEKIIINKSINATGRINFQLYNSDLTTQVINFSKLYNQTNTFLICLNNNLSSNENFFGDLQIQYEANGYESELYHIQNTTINSTKFYTNITLYDLNSTDSQVFKIIYKDSAFLPVTNALIEIQRKYIDEGLFRIVEILKSDDNGETTAHLVLNKIVYNLKVIKYGVILATFNNVIAVCQTPLVSPCEINLNAFSESLIVPDYEKALRF